MSIFQLNSSQMVVFSLFALSAAAAAKSLQSCLTLCNPIDSSLPGSLIPGILQARTLEWGYSLWGCKESDMTECLTQHGNLQTSQVARVVENLPAYGRDKRDPFWVGSLGSNPGKIPCRRARQPIPIFLPGKSHGQRSLVGYSP